VKVDPLDIGASGPNQITVALPAGSTRPLQHDRIKFEEGLAA